MLKDKDVYKSLSVKIKTKLSKNGTNATLMLQYHHEDKLILKYKHIIDFNFLNMFRITMYLYFSHNVRSYIKIALHNDGR